MRSHLVALCVAASVLPFCWLAWAEPSDAGTPTETLPNIGDDAGAPPGGYAPDPTPMVTRQQWVVNLSYRAGTIGFGGARRIELSRPATTPRAMGRFTIDLMVGKELVDRVRFDFPLLGADELAGTPRRWNSPPSFERHLSTGTSVTIPHSERATRALLVDRATGRIWLLPWPFKLPPDGGLPKGR